MVLATLRAPRSSIYVIQQALELDEDVNAELLESAWRKLAERHPALRSSVVLSTEGRFRQRVHSHCTTPIVKVDWNNVASDEKQQRLAEFLRQDWERGFNFDDGVPMRLTLVQHSERSYTLIWTIHHVLTDGGSHWMAWREWFEIYDALRRGEEIRLRQAKPFREHVEWIERQDWSRAEAFWKKYFEGVTRTTDYVIDRMRPAHFPGDEFARERLELPQELTGKLRSFASTYGVTLTTLVQGAWALLLARYSATSDDTADVVFGVTRAGRNSSVDGAEGIVGVFINTVPLRIAVPGDVPLISWLKQIREQWIALEEYEHTPIDKIWEWSGLPSGMPPFESAVVYNHQHFTETMRQLGGKWAQRRFIRRQRTDSSLMLAAFGKPTLALEIVYRQKFFGRECVRGMIGHLGTLLERFVEHSDRPLAELNMLTEREERWLIEELNQTETAFPRDLCVHRLFEQQAARIPFHTAFDTPQGTVTYQEVNRRANRLAAFLRDKSPAPDDFIAVCMDRSPEAVIAVLAIVKAGSAFLPLDPRLPEARLLPMLEDAHPKLVLADDASFSKLSSYGSEVLNLSRLEADIARYPDENLPETATPANAAYAIYTSGSTGKPKAVVITHRSLVSYVLAAARVYEITEADRRLQFGWMGSDFFVAEVFNNLSAGATLVFCLDRQGNSVAEFLQLLDQQRITITGMPSSWWHQWVSSFSDSELFRPGSLRVVVTGMEQVNPAALQAWRRQIGNTLRWFNAYGPTETTCTSTIYEAGSSEWEGDRFVPIGKPVANTRTYVLDRWGNPVPVGVPGELYIAGVGVGRGYLNSPELTAQRFLRDPFSADPEDRMYRTGDQVFYLPDGNIVFLGRLDRQVKIHGFRVELDEIEAILARHPAVRECAVVVQRHQDSELLVAYVSPAHETDPEPDQLHRHLSAHLPSHMIPAAFVTLARMPVTLSGKIDRRSLPPFEAEQMRPDLECQEPVTQTEHRLVEIWQRVLGVPVSGITSNFFELGGDSLKAAQVIMLIHQHLGQELPFTTLLRAPTIARIAALLDSGERPTSEGVSELDALLPLQPHGSFPPIFCISPTEDGPFGFRHLAKHLAPDQPLFVVTALPREGEPTPTVEQLARRAMESIRAARPQGPYILGGFCFGGTIAFETAQQLISMGQCVQMVILFDTPAPGYPKLIRGHRRNWRRFREVLAPDAYHRIISHWNMTVRLIKRKVIGQTERRFSGLELPADSGSWQERSTRMYAPAPIDVPVAQFIARDEAISTQILEDPRLSWRELSKREFHVHPVSGSHGTLLAEPQAMEPARILGELLRQEKSGSDSRWGGPPGPQPTPASAC
jgi:amino acid adenylation domain-containing protein